mmetsp:Transcript_53236/g.165027  ORF Transcript_53236/g.165027 Transcript_53236/m.165027 type:complete len:269 (+) Transcript_53236:94-900(+)
MLGRLQLLCLLAAPERTPCRARLPLLHPGAEEGGRRFQARPLHGPSARRHHPRMEPWPDTWWGRQLSLPRSAHTWALAHSPAHFVAMVDDDSFVCAGHLSAVLSKAPRSRFFLGYYWDTQSDRREQLCRADQDFLVYSRDVLEDAVKALASVPQDGSLNWALAWGRRAKHLFARGELNIFNDNVRVDSQQGYHLKPTSDNITADYCSSRIAMHIYPSITRVDAPGVMRKLYRSERVWKPAPGVAEPELKPPRCVFNATRACREDWMKC